MELDELKNLWNEENKKLEDRIKLNEKLIKKMNMEKTVGEFDKLLKFSILGRNLALVYFAISLVMAGKMIKEIEYSIPAILGGLAMLWSFISHLPIKKPDYEKSSILDLQKSICQFRIHTASNAKYDIAIVVFWILTLSPLYVKNVYKIAIYNNTTYLLVFCLVAILFIVVTIVLSRKVYKKYEQKLKQSEAYLEEIMEFEKR